MAFTAFIVGYNIHTTEASAYIHLSEAY